MYKIMLVEDETLVRDSMMENIPWSQYNFQLTAGCCDGQEAIDCLDKELPHVVVTDICMPNVDGLALARYIHEHYPSILVVILTGFNDFSYAQQALKLRVTDFILKPILLRDFALVLQRLSAELDLQHNKRDDMRLLFHRAQQAESLLRNMLLKRILSEPIPTDELRSMASKANVGFSSPVHAVLVAQIRNHTPNITQSQFLLDCAQSTATQFPNCSYGLVDEKYVMLILGGRTPAEASQRARSAATLLLRTVSKVVDVSGIVGFGDCTQTLADIHTSANQAMYALGYGFTSDRNVISYALAKKEEYTPSSGDMMALYHKILKAMREHDETLSLSLLQDLFLHFTANGLHRENCVPILERLRFALMEMIPPQSLEMAPQIPSAMDWHQEQFVFPYFAAIVSFLHKNLQPSMNDSAARCVRSAELLIGENFQDSEFNLAKLLALLNVSKSYFSANFKSYTNQTFTEYLTGERIKKATHYLEHTNLCTYEIAEKIGFVDPHYFSVTFKRYMGKSPRDYREALG